jgi:hypothetical protein
MSRRFLFAIANCRHLVFGALLCSGLASVAPAQLNQQGRWEHGLNIPSGAWSVPKVSADELNTLILRWSSIGNEIKNTTNTFAGTYWTASNHAAFLRWAPQTGFVYVKTYEQLNVVDFSYGNVVTASENIQFVVERDLHSTFFGKRLTPITQVWIPTEWEQQMYLVESKRISDFSLFSAGLGRYNEYNGPCCEGSPFLVRIADSALTGKDEAWQSPRVPPQYVRFIRRPIEAVITFVGQKRFVNGYGLKGPDYSQWFPKASLTPLGINAGAVQGVRRGLLFRIRHAPYGQYLKITYVRKNRSTGVMIRDVDDYGRETYIDSADNETKYPPITRGQRVTTSPRF